MPLKCTLFHLEQVSSTSIHHLSQMRHPHARPPKNAQNAPAAPSQRPDRIWSVCLKNRTILPGSSGWRVAPSPRRPSGISRSFDTPGPVRRPDPDCGSFDDLRSPQVGSGLQVTHRHVVWGWSDDPPRLDQSLLELFWASERCLCPEGFDFNVSRLMWCTVSEAFSLEL